MIDFSKLEMFIDGNVLGEIHAQAAEKFPGQPTGLLLSDPSCCGGVIQINIRPIPEIEKFKDVLLVFPANYKDFGFPIYIDKATLEDPVEHMRIILKSKNPPKFSFENNDFWTPPA
jgi:hypothetical protein